MAKKANEIVPLQVRMRSGLLKKLQMDAKRNDQSLNAEIVGRLEGTYDEVNEALDFQKTISVMVDGPENAKLLSMIVSAFHLLSSGINGKIEADTFTRAVHLITMAHFNNFGPMRTLEEVLKMEDFDRRGHIVANIILTRRGYPPIMPEPDEPSDRLPLLSGLGQYFTPPSMSLADLGKRHLDKGK